MKYFKRRLLKGHRCFGEEWMEAMNAYYHHLESIQSILPESATLLCNHMKRRTFHDATVEHILRGPGTQVTIDLDDRRLEFIGVHQYDYSGNSKEENSWLYTEIDIADKGAFELRVLLEDGELSIIANEVRLYDKLTNRYLIPDTPPPPPPTLFLDRLQKHKKRKKRR